MKQDKLKFDEKLKQISQRMLNSLDYSDTRAEKKPEGYKSKFNSLMKQLGNMPKILYSSIKYHCKMMYLIPVGFISERCCKKRMPSSFFKKNQ